MESELAFQALYDTMRDGQQPDCSWRRLGSAAVTACIASCIVLEPLLLQDRG